jgi:DNA polymerase I-like protein with 3'-5' exonuclease and polymerase domains
VFLQADYEQLELRTLAQACITLFGFSKLGEALNAGRDPHTEVAARILKKDYEWCIANKKVYEVDMARQTGKVANFGFPGG